MPHGNRAAVDVDLVVIDIERLLEQHDNAGEGFVDLKQINVADRHPVIGKDFLGHRNRAGQHDRRIGADFGGRLDAGTGFQTILFAKLFVANQNSRRAIDDARRVACMVDVIHPFKLGVFLQGNLVETGHDLALILEAGFQCSERLHISARAHEFVIIKDRQTIHIAHRHDGFGETFVVPRRLGPLLAFNSHRIGHVTGKPIAAGDNVRADALRNKVVVDGNRRVHGNRTAIRHHRYTAHAFHTTGDIGIARAAPYLIGGHVDGFQPACTEAVDRHAGDAFIKFRGKNSRPRKACALFCDLGDIAPDHVLNRVTFQIIAALDRVQSGHAETIGTDFMERAVFPALAARSAHGVIDIGFVHFNSPHARSAGLPGINS